AREAQRGRTVARLADDRDLALVREERADALADGEMIVGDENADHRSCSPFLCARADVWKLCWGASQRASRARGRSECREELRAATEAIETGSKRKAEVEPGLKPAGPLLCGRRLVLGAQLDAALAAAIEAQMQVLKHLNDRPELRGTDRFSDRDRERRDAVAKVAKTKRVDRRQGADPALGLEQPGERMDRRDDDLDLMKSLRYGGAGLRKRRRRRRCRHRFAERLGPRLRFALDDLGLGGGREVDGRRCWRYADGGRWRELDRRRRREGRLWRELDRWRRREGHERWRR